MENDSGIERVKSLFRLSPETPLPEELQQWPPTVLLSTGLGFLFGGFIGARWAGDKYIAMNHNTKYTHAMQAQRELHSAAMLGFLRQGIKWGWKMGFFAGTFSGCMILLSTYRDKEDSLNMIASGGMTGLLFRVRYGIKPAIGGLVLGTLISTPASLAFNSIDWLLVSEEEKRKTKERRLEARQKRDRSWNERLEGINEIVDILGVHQEDTTQSGLEKFYTITKSEKK